jgi:hypothetical protein
LAHYLATPAPEATDAIQEETTKTEQHQEDLQQESPEPLPKLNAVRHTISFPARLAPCYPVRSNSESLASAQARSSPSSYSTDRGIGTGPAGVAAMPRRRKEVMERFWGILLVVVVLGLAILARVLTRS